MDSIFHEKQEGSLCAQHCLNSLLQGAYFSAVDLATIAQELDDAEGAHMAEGGVDSMEYLRFQEQPSSNMDDSGFFSIQVISRALAVWGLLSVPIGSPEAGSASLQPQRECAFICNFREHWLTIRKLGNQWFNLNSLLTGPELISDTYLTMLLAQLQKDGYSIFVIRGSLPESEADQLLKLIPAVQRERPKLLSELVQSSSTGSQSASTAGSHVTQADLKRALDASNQSLSSHEEDKDGLQEAIRLSLQASEDSSATAASKPVDVDEVRRKREAFFNRQTAGESAINENNLGQNLASSHTAESRGSSSKESNTNNSATTTLEQCVEETKGDAVAMVTSSEDMTESAMLEAAIRMSMEPIEQKT